MRKLCVVFAFTLSVPLALAGEKVENAQPTSFPPVPAEVASVAVCVDEYVSARCKETPSGLGNCTMILQSMGHRTLLKNFVELIGLDPKKFSVTLGAQIHESPLVRFAAAEQYGLRFCAVRAEAEYYMLGIELAKARYARDREKAERLSVLLAERYPQAPSPEQVAEATKAIAHHFSLLWEWSGR